MRCLLRDLIYLLALPVAAPWLVYKALTSRKFRAGFRERLAGAPPPPGAGPAIWIHAASVGEVQAAAELARALPAARPGCRVCLSVMTLEGRRAAERLCPELPLFYVPLDFSWCVRRALARVRPALLILVEKELWPNLVELAGRRGTPVAVANARLAPERAARTARLQRLPGLGLFLVYGRIALFCAQSEAHSRALESVGVPRERLVLAGNLKYDRPPPADPGAARAAGRARLGAGPEDFVFVAGSTHAAEEEAALAAAADLRRTGRTVRLVLAPRHTERAAEVAALAARLGAPAVRLSALAAGARPPPEAAVVVDTVGELKELYAAADAAFVGGSLAPVGGHNVMEPAAWGVPVLVGPHHRSFAEEVRLLAAAQAAEIVADAGELSRRLAALAADPARATAAGARGREALAGLAGAVARHLAALAPLLPGKPG